MEEDQVNSGNEAGNLVAVVGAGPAGIYASKQLADAGVRVVLLNRDIKPGGLAEYGIYHDKYKMKEGLRKQFRQILANPNIHYFGNVTVGAAGTLSLQDLRDLGCQAILVTVGAQGTKWLGLPGEELQGVYHAKDIVYHYNQLPPFSQEEFHIGRRAALIGVGNVMVDVAHWLVRDLKIDEVVAVARRGPAEVKFTKKEMESVVANLDVPALDAEIARVAPLMLDVGQDPTQARDFILSAQAKGEPATSDTVLRFEFLSSPTAIVDDGHGRVGGLEVEDTKLVPRNGDTRRAGWAHAACWRWTPWSSASATGWMTNWACRWSGTSSSRTLRRATRLTAFPTRPTTPRPRRPSRAFSWLVGPGRPATGWWAWRARMARWGPTHCCATWRRSQRWTPIRSTSASSG